jgi:hypothetical protein
VQQQRPLPGFSPTWYISNLRLKENDHQLVANLNDASDTFGHTPEKIAVNIAFQLNFN